MNYNKFGKYCLYGSVTMNSVSIFIDIAYVPRSETDIHAIFIGWLCLQQLVNIERAKVKMGDLAGTRGPCRLRGPRLLPRVANGKESPDRDHGICKKPKKFE